MNAAKTKGKDDRKLKLLKTILLDDLGLTQEDLDEAWQRYRINHHQST